jgi:lambda family phage portal protein
VSLHWIDRITQPIAPRWTLKRVRARAAAELLARYYDAAAAGRRTAGWRRTKGDANAAVAAAAADIREQARDLVRNNAYAASALDTIVNHTVGWGIVAASKKTAPPLWTAWADSTACDADGRNDFAGLQKLVMRTVVEAGEVLVRRRWRRAADGLPIPMQLQVLEPDFLDVTRDITAPSGRVVQGIEFDAIGRRVAYWLYPEHPGGRRSFAPSNRIPAEDVLHVFRPGRAGQVRGVSWLAPVILRMKDFDDYEDAALMKQKIAACLAILTTDADGATSALGAVADPDDGTDSLEPGMIKHITPGRSVSVVQPPSVSEHAEYAQTVLRAIATGLGVAYEDLCGDYTGLPFSAARMSRLRHWARVEDWRWRMLIPQFCDPVWRWAMQAAQIVADSPTERPVAQWTPPPPTMIDPEKEGLALQRLMRIGGLTWPEMVRERGYDPEAQLEEIRDWNERFDAAGVVLDSDPRKTSQQGQPRDPKDAAAGAAQGGEE